MEKEDRTQIRTSLKKTGGNGKNRSMEGCKYLHIRLKTTAFN